MLLFDRSSWPLHKRWAVFVAVLSVAILALGIRARVVHGAWLGGGSWLGLPCGVAAAGVCVFEFLLWPRKRWRTLRVGRAQAWMRAHIWLGLLLIPLVLAHAGFGLHHAGRVSFGGTLTTALAVVFIVVIASGVWGLAVQQRLPRRMLEELPYETIYAQIDHVGAYLAQEGAYLVLTTCGPEPGTANPDEIEDLAFVPGTALHRHLTSGAAPAAPAARRRLTGHVPNAEALRVFFREAVKPYLENEKEAARRSILRFATQAESTFNDLRKRLPLAAHPAVAALERLCDQRRQFDQQVRLQFWLHSWLWVHLPLSIALMLLLAAHVATCWIYW
jgi:hypothetical protein